MDAEISHSEQWLRFLAWLEINWRRVAAVGLVVIVAGIVVAFVVWQGGQKQRHASEALSMLMASPGGMTGDALVRFAEDNGGTVAGTRALLLAGGALFTEGRFQEAQDRFEKFLGLETEPSLTAKAQMGVAACKEALGQTDAAISDYRSLVDDPASGNVSPHARFALGGLYVQQGQMELAREQYQALAMVQGSSLAAEAQARLADLPPVQASTEVTIPSLASPAMTTTNQP